MKTIEYVGGPVDGMVESVDSFPLFRDVEYDPGVVRIYKGMPPEHPHRHVYEITNSASVNGCRIYWYVGIQ